MARQDLRGSQTVAGQKQGCIRGQLGGSWRQLGASLAVAGQSLGNTARQPNNKQKHIEVLGLPYTDFHQSAIQQLIDQQ